jgi:hypothetical protein
MIEILPSCVQHGGEADLGPEMFGIGGDRRKRSRGGPEQKPIDLRLVLIGDCADLGGQREHHMEIGNRQEFRAARRHPSLRRVPLTVRAVSIAAGIIGNARIGAIRA